MPVKPRFVRAADSRRPYGSHRFDVWSPKLRRRLTLFGKRPFETWLAIEADPSILTFCERPLLQKAERHNRVIDYWVQRQTTEEIWVLSRASELPKKGSGAPLFAGFDDWARKLQIGIRYIGPEEELLNQQAASNWRYMLHYLAANRDLIPRFMLDRLQAAGSPGRSIQDLTKTIPCWLGAAFSRSSNAEPSSRMLSTRRSDRTREWLGRERISLRQ